LLIGPPKVDRIAVPLTRLMIAGGGRTVWRPRFAGRFLRGGEDRDQLVGFIDQRRGDFGCTEVRFSQRFQPTLCFIGFLTHDPDLRDEFSRGSRSTRFPVVAADRSSRVDELWGNATLRVGVRQGVTQCDDCHQKCFRALLLSEGLVVHTAGVSKHEAG
jgi:hypothetical protein